MTLRPHFCLLGLYASLCGCSPPVDQTELVKHLSGASKVTIIVEDRNGIHPPIVLDTREEVHQFVCGIVPQGPAVRRSNSMEGGVYAMLCTCEFRDGATFQFVARSGFIEFDWDSRECEMLIDGESFHSTVMALTPSELKAKFSLH